MHANSGQIAQGRLVGAAAMLTGLLAGSGVRQRCVWWKAWSATRNMKPGGRPEVNYDFFGLVGPCLGLRHCCLAVAIGVGGSPCNAATPAAAVNIEACRADVLKLGFHVPEVNAALVCMQTVGK